jgi:type VI secretion system protein ImpH
MSLAAGGGGGLVELRSRILAHAKKYTYYKLLHDLEKLGCRGPESLTIRPVASRVFPARDVYELNLQNGGVADGEAGSTQDKAEVVAWFGGLYGVDSPLPLYFDDILEEDSPRGENLRRLLTLVGNRFYHLFYEIWSRMAPLFCSEEALEDYVRKPVLSICGVGHLGKSRINVLAGSPYLVQRMRNRWGLSAMLNHFLEVPVDVREFDPARVPLRQRDRTRLGDPDTAVLGRNLRATPYRETFATHVRIVCGPLDSEEYRSLLPGGERYVVLTYMAFRYFPDDLEYRLELVLAAHSFKDVRFWLKRGDVRLGATTVLGTGRTEHSLRIVREGVSPASRPEALREVVNYVESKDQASP